MKCRRSSRSHQSALLLFLQHLLLTSFPPTERHQRMSNPPHRRPIPTGPSPSTSSSSSSGANNASSNSAFSTSRPAGSTPSAAAAAAAKGKAPAPMGGARVVVPGAGGGGAQGQGQAGGGGGAALVQRKTLNSILVSTRQVRSSSPPSSNPFSRISLRKTDC